ncbi:MAG: D-alanyl-D-alanine carboxypeptidase/D-alanyl-D-alanine-endopeptidase [Deltaproteobacteria bacterium]|nr:D-alanyl-D-alanine carboxypeptidase/D-alanyl-D-alanine-endopeptidase [Deltaproteobacteria bacterium]
MKSLRGLLLVAVAVVSMDSGPAGSQPGPGSGSGGPADPADPPTDEEAGGGSGSGSALVAPKDVNARLPWLREKLTAAVTSRPMLATARVAYAITDLKSGLAIANREHDTPMNLASNAKLLTGVAALAGLGGGFRWRTAVYAETEPDETGTIKGDLFVRGRGDPTLTVGALDQLAADVAARGVRNVEGKLVLDTSYFDGAIEPPHFEEQPKERAAFRAPVASFGVNRSAVVITVMTEPGGGSRITLEPQTDYIKIAKQEVTSVPVGRTRLRVEIKTKPKPRPELVELEITGQIRIGEGSWDLKRRVDDPARFAGEVFRKALATHGVKIRQRALGSGTVPLTAKVVAHHDSPPLTEVVRWMNKHSDNYIAESLMKTLGAERKGTPGPATWADGSAALRAQLATLGLPAGSYRSDNGSGLYAATEVSAKQLVGLLAAAHQDYRIGPDLVASLPVGGFDGTLSRRWHGKPAQGRVRAKTGTLDKVTTLAGYIAVEPTQVLGFAVLVNDIPAGQRRFVREMVDEMVEIMAAYLGAR